MDGNGSRAATLIGVAAAAGAFGVAAMMSAASAPTARADDFTDLINDINLDYSYGQTAFTTAFTDFSSDQFVPGLERLIAGVDDYTLSTENTLLIGTAEVLQGDPINSTESFGFIVPPSYGDAVTTAQSFFTGAETDLGLVANDFASGDYVTGTEEEILGLDYSSILPLEELLLGAAVSF
jgi:hypothetical protein